MATLAGLAIAQLYIVLRLTVRLGFAASQIALFQGRLAHAGYTARPPRAVAGFARRGGDGAH